MSPPRQTRIRPNRVRGFATSSHAGHDPMQQLLLSLLTVTLAQPGDSLAAWKSGVKVAPVSGADHHSIHAYFNTTPESPDGRHIVFYVSTTTDGQDGEIRVRERSTGRETVLA